MQALEHRIPPPLIAALIAVLMWIGAQYGPNLGIDVGWRLSVGAVLALLGLAVTVSGVRAFKQAGTTVNPVKIETASSLVTDGIFSMTRNPMYLGMALLLLGWTAYLASPWAIPGPIAFVLFINRFQIAPEERAMQAKFGKAYEDYQQRVRRWM